ncbi:MAG: serine/threonine-protein kinase [Planctomycetaceae bacterium]
MSESERAELLAELLEDYHRRRALGEAPQAEDYKARAGADYGEFLQILAAESAIDDVMEIAQEPGFPRTFGGYTLLRELGRGAMGVVYEAVHRELGRTVALKVLRTGFDTQPQALERFRREARACAQIHHDHIVAVYEAGEIEERPYYAMTLLEGKSLGDLIRAKAVPPARELCAALAGVADALHRLHQAGIVHRDLKPSNLMRLEEGGRIVLADFGLARTIAAESLTLTGEALGTPLYMSPEQLLARQDEINGRTDVYGLAASLYEALALRPVFKAQDMAGLMRMILSERPTPLHEVAPQVPRACSDIVMKGLEKQNGDRYEDAAAFRDDLLAFSRGDTVAGKPLSRRVHLLRKARRHWMPLTAAAALFLTAGFLWGNRSASLRIHSFPAAEVVIDGVVRGQTPAQLELAPGSYTLVLRRPGFDERPQRIDVSAGEKTTIQQFLIAKDTNDPAVREWMEKEFDVAMAALDDERTRGASRSGEVNPLFPRGNVRIRDLDALHVDAPLSAEADGAIELRIGKELLFSAELVAPDHVERVTLALPEALLARLKPGVKAVWGYYPRKGRPATAEFTVVDEDPALEARLERFAKRMEGKNPILIRQMRAQLLLNNRLHYAAFREAQRVLDEVEGSEAACAIQIQAVRAMDIEETCLGGEVLSRKMRILEHRRGRVR